MKRLTALHFPRITLVVLVLLGTLSGCASQSIRLPKIGAVVACSSITLGKRSSGLEFPCLDGKSVVQFSQMRGPLIVNVWGSWCAPCKDEIPMIRSFYSKNQSTVDIVGIDVEEAHKIDGVNFVLANGMTWPILIDPDGRSRGFFGMGVPVTWFIDSSGKVVYKKIGVLNSEQELRELANKYLHLTLS